MRGERKILWPRLGVAILLATCLLAVSPGCLRRAAGLAETPRGHVSAALGIEQPGFDPALDAPALELTPPPTLRGNQPTQVWPLTLDDVVQVALAQTVVVRDLGARIVATPAATGTIYDPAIQETDPRVGPEAALAAFDAQLAAQLLFNRDERTLNNAFFGGGITSLVENTGNYQSQFSKTGATGGRFSLRHRIDYNRNNSPANLFPSAYDALVEAEVRQPLLLGGGLQFNRIAGPGATPGSYNGVLIARVNTDVALADFEAHVRDFVNELQRTYWQLYFSYRDLDSRIAGRDAALETWRVEKAKLDAGDADAEQEALAREQYFAAQAEVENALSGTATSGLVVGTSGGVYTVERRLRRLMGLPPADGRLIRPADSPSQAEVRFDWDSLVATAHTRRVELRRQQWEVRRREMELAASRHFLRSRLDFVGQYRWRGFGDDLLGRGDEPNGSAIADLYEGDLEGWRLGFELSTPIGRRTGYAAVRNAELQVARARAIYGDQRAQVTDDIASALAELDRAYTVTRTLWNLRLATRERLEAVRAKVETGEVLLEFLLEAQRRVTDADSAYYRALVNYNLAVAAIHLQQGTLLDYLGVELTEQPWSAGAQAALDAEGRRLRPRRMNYAFTIPAPIGGGAYPQRILALPPVEAGEEAGPEPDPERLPATE